MSTVKSEYKYIEFRDDGVPVITGTKTKVTEIIQEKLFWGWNPEQIHLQHPYLSLAQIYSAFAYYADHEDELNREIERRYREAEEIRKSIPEPPFVEKLRNDGLI